MGFFLNIGMKYWKLSLLTIAGSGKKKKKKKIV
jgi:hypothetical protein